MVEGYKIVEIKDGTIRTLFHGTQGSRKLETGKWLEADVRTGYDGSRDRATAYRTGWHLMPSIGALKKLSQRFKNRTNRYVVRCQAKDVWEKEHSPYDILLARWLYIPENCVVAKL